jgi:DegV family protein with EDD domain
MSRVAFVIDSTAYVPKELTEGHPIHVVPLVVIWSGETLRDGYEIEPDQFYARLKTAKELPSTSQPSPAAMKEVYEKLLAEGYEILSVLISSKFSGTVASAKQALDQLPGAKIELIDSMTASMGVGWPVVMAARAAAKGAGLAECKAIVEKALQNTGVLLMVDTLEFLHRGGRIGGAQRFLGTALNLKPILEVVDGAFVGLERVRTQRKALARLVDLLEERIAGRSPVRLAVIHSAAPEVAAGLLERAAARLNPIETATAKVSPTVGVHVGPGAVGLSFTAEVD